MDKRQVSNKTITLNFVSVSFKFKHNSSKLFPKIDLKFKCRTLNNVDFCIQNLLKSFMSNKLHVLYIDNQTKYKYEKTLLQMVFDGK